MGNFNPVRPLGTWINGKPVLATEMNAFDLDLTKIWTGEGGAFAPSDAIRVRGTFATWLQGPTSFSTGALVVNLSASGSKFTFGDNDYFELVNAHTGASRTITQEFLEYAAINDGTYGQDNGGAAAIRGQAAGASFAIRLRVHDGATFTTATIAFAVRFTHTNPPQYFPKFRIVAVALDGTKTPLATPAGGNNADANGWIAIPAVSAGAWNATTSFVYTLDANTVVDATKVYVLEVVDESGTNAFPDVHTNDGKQNAWFSVQSAFTTIADTRPG